MKRRALLAAVSGLSGLSGCTALPGGRTPSPTKTPDSGPPLAERGSPSNVCRRDVVDLGIYAVDEPAFGPDWSAVGVDADYAESGELDDDDVVVGIQDDGTARAYPMSILWKHEIVNDVFPAGPTDDGVGGPLLVTYCSLCRSGMVARRRVNGEVTKFGVSGQLWRPPELYTRAAASSNRTFAVERGDADPGEVRNTGNLVMFDVATGSYWSQLLARAICGVQRGTKLPIVPAETATWADWRDAHPGTEVLLPPPHSAVMELPF